MANPRPIANTNTTRQILRMGFMATKEVADVLRRRWKRRRYLFPTKKINRCKTAFVQFDRDGNPKLEKGQDAMRKLGVHHTPEHTCHQGITHWRHLVHEDRVQHWFKAENCNNDQDRQDVKGHTTSKRWKRRRSLFPINQECVQVRASAPCARR